MNYLRAFMLTILMAASTGGVVAQSIALAPEDVVATRGGVDLTVGLIDQEVARMPSTIKHDYMEDPARAARLIDKLLLTKQLGLAALEQGLEVPDEYKGIAIDQDLDALTVMANALLRSRELAAPELDYELIAAERYRARKSTYATEELFHLRILSISHDTRGEVAAKLLAGAARERALNGEDFGALIEELDDSPDAKERAESVAFTVARLLRAPDWLQRAVMLFGESPGISDVINDDGYSYIVQMADYTPSIIPSFEEIKGRIVEEARAEALVNARTTLMRSFSLQDVELNPDVVQKLADRYQE